jgi:serine/threonine protein kinase
MSTLYKLRGTYGYTAPELYNKEKCTNKADVFSLGVIIWEVLVRCLKGEYVRPYSDNKQLIYDFQLLVAVAKKGVRPTIPPNCPEEFKIMLQSCWDEDPEKRPDCGFLLMQINMLKGLKYNKQKEAWDALLPVTAQVSLAREASASSLSASGGGSPSSAPASGDDKPKKPKKKDSSGKKEKKGKKGKKEKKQGP